MAQGTGNAGSENRAVMRRIFIAAGIAAGLSTVNPVFADPEPLYRFEEKPWIEGRTAIPAFPQEADLIEFYVGPTERNRFFVDASTIAIGDDGVIRYVVVVRAAGGARNVSLEAMRCATREVKLFAIGGQDDSWSPLPNPQWQRIESKSINQYRAVLNRDFFCPSGYPVRDANEARSALRRGRHPEA